MSGSVNIPIPHTLANNSDLCLDCQQSYFTSNIRDLCYDY